VSALLVLLLAGGPPEPPTMTAAALAGELRIDGRLDEAAWARAPAASGFRQREPREGEPATQPTEVRVLYDARNLYIGVLARDAEPRRAVAHIRQRDKLLEAAGYDNRYQFAGDDAVAILLDPFRDRRNAVVFATNPNGAEFDALITDESSAFNADWRAVWTVRAQRVPEGWSAEIAIPFRSLRYPSASSGPDGWGINVWRIVRRTNEETLWTAWSRDGGGFQRVSQAGRLVGLANLPRSGLNLEVKPYGLAGLTQEPRDGGSLRSTRDFDAGLDAKWEVRPGVVLDGTLHPDFAQVEADDEQVNLTRFDLFFPEKRDFFLENAGIFDFGWRGVDETPPFILFFSRRIGIARDDESAIPVRGGVRLSGRVGGQTVGFLDVYTGAGAGQPSANYGVLRLKRDFGKSNYVGGMLVDRRDRGGGAGLAPRGSNTAGGLDASFWPAENVNLQAFAARTWTSGPGGDGSAWHVSGDYTGDRFGVFAQHLYVGPGADPEVGFVTRADIRRTDAFARVTLRPPTLGLRRIDVFAEGQHIVRTDGEKQDGGAGPTLNVEWNSGDSVAAFYFAGSTRLDEPFDLGGRLPVPAGDYRVRQWSAAATSASSRPVMVSLSAERSDSFGGRLDTRGARARVSPGSHLNLELAFTHNRVRLPAGSFTADVSSLRLLYAFTTRLFASALVQHNRLERRLVTNLRLGFIHRPGSDLFVVFNEDRGDGVSLRPVANRGLAVKLTYLTRF
jgi:Domain of unknown function (DUF5916)